MQLAWAMDQSKDAWTEDQPFASVRLGPRYVGLGLSLSSLSQSPFSAGLIHTTRASGYLKVKKQLEGDKENGELKQQKDAALQDGWMQYMFS